MPQPLPRGPAFGELLADPEPLRALLAGVVAAERERLAHEIHDTLAQGLTSIVLGAYLHSLTVHAFSWLDLVKVLLTLGALLLVSSVASNTLSRAAVLSGAEFDPQTRPNDLTGAPPPGPGERSG